MASKRDQLRKLRESRAQQSIEEMSSPAEDKLKELEAQEEKTEKTDEIEDNKEVQEENLNDIQEKETADSVTEEADIVQKTIEPEQKAEPEKREDATKEKTKRTSMALLVENNKFIRLRSMQLGYSIQNYVNLLIEEEIERDKEKNSMDLAEITDNLDMNYRRGQNSTIVALVLKESNARFLKRGGAMFGMNATTFLNHIISEEQRREKENGPRRGEFDE